MIFVVEGEELTLYAFPTEAEAVSHCEGVDVEAGIWLFWNDRGQPLEPRFSAPNKRGLFTTVNGKYSLVASGGARHAPLLEVIGEILHFECPEPFNAETGVRDYLSHRPAE